MALRRKRNKVMEWFCGLFSSKATRYVWDGPQRHAGSEGFFNNAQHSTFHNPTMMSVQGNQYQYMTYVRLDEGDRNIVTHIMGLLSKHIIPGAAHDSSPREPPPRCHPGTRVKLIARITAWFENQASLELLLWITGPAGVGKSAIVQTFAEYLAKCKLLGASVFISRPNKRDNPHGIFTTIAYQLATRIEAYRDYIVERLSRDPELLGGGMQAQFMAFIVEPFVEKKIIGNCEKRWGILLDGLDELRGTHVQCEIIKIISTFAREHRDAPLMWIIASRPESHITNTFEDDKIRRSCWSEHVPIDSTEVCEDVERFLRSSFETTQKIFRHSVDTDWPSDTDFLKLTATASGLFIYAQVVMEFIRDPHHADPVSQFGVLLSIIDRSNAVSTKENPFVHLDALYSEILSSIPPTLWPTTKRLLSLAIHGGKLWTGWRCEESRRNFSTLRGMSILFGITRNVVYASLDKCPSTLRIPDWKVAHENRLIFLHASFADYLKDSTRSGDFHVGNAIDIKGEVILRLLEIWNKCSGDNVSAASVEATWHQNCSKLQVKSSSRRMKEFYTRLFHDTVSYLGQIVPEILDGPRESPAYALVWKVHIRKLCYFLNAGDMIDFVRAAMRLSPHIPGLLWEEQLRDLEFGHLNTKEMSPASARYRENGMKGKSWMIHHMTPKTSAVSDLESFQESSPGLNIRIIGGIPKERVAVFRRPLNEYAYSYREFAYHVVPYPE